MTSDMSQVLMAGETRLRNRKNRANKIQRRTGPILAALATADQVGPSVGLSQSPISRTGAHTQHCDSWQKANISHAAWSRTPYYPRGVLDSEARMGKEAGMAPESVCDFAACITKHLGRYFPRLHRQRSNTFDAISNMFHSDCPPTGGPQAEW